MRMRTYLKTFTYTNVLVCLCDPKGSFDRNSCLCMLHAFVCVYICACLYVCVDVNVYFYGCKYVCINDVCMYLFIYKFCTYVSMKMLK